MARMVFLDELKPGMVLAYPILSDRGLLLLSEGVILGGEHLRMLRANGVLCAHVREPEPRPETAVPPLLRPSSMDRAVQVLKGAFDSAAQGDGELLCARLEDLSSVVEEIQDEVLSQPELVAHCHDLRNHDDYTFRHSVHVMVMSLILGRGLDMPSETLSSLAMGAVLHDIGKTRIPLEILNKPGALDPEEMEVMRRHADLGAQILDLDPRLAPEVREVLRQHHERWDGSGYPRGLKGRGIHPFARQVAVADVYDALASARPYKSQRFAHEVFQFVAARGGTLFDPQVVAVFSHVTTPYPRGTWLILSSGHVGMVTRVERGHTLRPEVTAVHHLKTGPLARPLMIDLERHPRLEVQDVLPGALGGEGGAEPEEEGGA